MSVNSRLRVTKNKIICQRKAFYKQRISESCNLTEQQVGLPWVNESGTSWASYYQFCDFKTD